MLCPQMKQNHIPQLHKILAICSAIIVIPALGDDAYLPLPQINVYYDFNNFDTSGESFALKLTFEVDFDLEVSGITIFANCSAYATRSEDCDSWTRCAYNESAVWSDSEWIDNNDDYFITMHVSTRLDCFKCFVWYECPYFIPWYSPPSEPTKMELPSCNQLNPAPVLYLSQIKIAVNPHLKLLYFDVHSLNQIGNAIETTNGPYVTFDSLGYEEVYSSISPVCVDELAYSWVLEDRPNLNETCVIRKDVWSTNTSSPPLQLECFERPSHLDVDIVCYQPKGLIFYTKPTRKYGWQLVQGDTRTGVKKIVVDINNTTPCGLRLDSGRISIDWRPYWAQNKNQDGSIIFMSNASLWSYNIGNRSCERIFELTSFGLEPKVMQEIAKIASDWFNVYWLNKTTRMIHASAWNSGKNQVLKSIRGKSEIRPLTDVQDILTVGRAMVPNFQDSPQCFDFRVNISVRMTSSSTAALKAEIVWQKLPPPCYSDDHPPLQLKLYLPSNSCEGRSAAWLHKEVDLKPCPTNMILSPTYVGRLRTYTTEISGLADGNSYTVFGVVSQRKMDKKNYNPYKPNLATKTFKQPFVADYEPRTRFVSKPWPWWAYLLTVLLAVIILTTLFLLIRGYLIQRAKVLRTLRKRIDASQIKAVERLGNGQFGEVWLCHYNRDDGQLINVALKLSKHTFVSMVNTTMGMNLACADCFFQEITALEYLCHDNIIKALGVCTNFKLQDGRTAPGLILEFMNGGSAINYVKSEGAHLTRQDLLHIFIGISNAGIHLSQMGVVHRDIGARNVLIQKQPNGKPIIAKLTDFGLAKDVGKKTGVYKTTNPDRAMFNIRFTSPEGFEGRFTSQSDVWSFGEFMWEVYELIDMANQTGRSGNEPVPYSHLDTQKEIWAALNRGYRLEQPAAAPQDMYVIMGTCWSEKPDTRPTFEQLKSTFLLCQKQVRQNRVRPTNSRISNEIPMEPPTEDSKAVSFRNSAFENDHPPSPPPKCDYESPLPKCDTVIG